jgi:hypothetical protein
VGEEENNETSGVRCGVDEEENNETSGVRCGRGREQRDEWGEVVVRKRTTRRVG